MKEITNKITGHKDIVEARRFIFSQMQALANEEITIEQGLVQAKLAHQLMEGYKVQIRAMEIMTISTSNPIIDAKDVTAQLEK